MTTTTTPPALPSQFLAGLLDALAAAQRVLGDDVRVSFAVDSVLGGQLEIGVEQRRDGVLFRRSVREGIYEVSHFSGGSADLIALILTRAIDALAASAAGR